MSSFYVTYTGVRRWKMKMAEDVGIEPNDDHTLILRPWIWNPLA